MNKFLFIGNKVDQNTVMIADEDFRHCIKVLRYKLEDAIQCTDGLGNHFVGKISDIRKKELLFEIEEEHYVEARTHQLHIAIAPTKNMSRIETMIEKCVEIGVDEISFLKTKNSERKIVKIDRVKKIALSAMKQSFRTRVPILHEMCDFGQFLVETSVNDFKYLLHYKEGAKHLHDASWGAKNIVLIGPEGDFTAEEVYASEKAGYQNMILGETKLRTETAGIVACSIFNVINR